jgi:hypothetical protein
MNAYSFLISAQYYIPVCGTFCSKHRVFVLKLLYWVFDSFSSDYKEYSFLCCNVA